MCLRATLLVTGLWAGLTMMPVAQAAPHPVHYRNAREVEPHPARSRHVKAQTAPSGDKAKPVPKAAAPKKNSPSASKAKAGAAAAQAKPAPKPHAKTRRKKLRPEDEADNDPLVIHRVAEHESKAKRSAVPARNIAGRRSAEPAVQEAAVTQKALTYDDFVRAAGGDAAAEDKATQPGGEIFAQGQSRPDDDERLPVKQSSQIVATVSAVPERSAPVAGPIQRGKAKAMPEDHASRAAVVEEAMMPMVMPTLRMRHGRVIAPPPLKGSWEVLVHQNIMADSEGLDRIQDDDALDRMRELHLLVPLADSRSLQVNEDLPDNRRYARPWAARFAADTARAFYSRFHQPLHLNSAVRTVEYQLQLQRVNGNAAAIDGDGASPHLTGQALDFGKRGMSRLQIAWMRAYLQPLMRAGKVDVEEEFQQSCFHISVYRGYTPLLMKEKAKTADVARVEPPLHTKAAPAER